MNYKSLIDLETERLEFLKKHELDEENINKFKLGIKKVSEEEATKLGKELLETITKKGYNDNHKAIIQLIYDGADIEYKEEKNGNYPLLICARKNYLKTFIVLLNAGANINQVNNFLTTATMASAKYGNKEILEILIIMGADINARYLDGDTALSSAKLHDNVECFNMLVASSAYLNTRNMSNKTLMDINKDSKANFDLSQMPASIILKPSNDSPFESAQKLLDEASIKLGKIINK